MIFETSAYYVDGICTKNRRNELNYDILAYAYVGCDYPRAMTNNSRAQPPNAPRAHVGM